MHVEIGKNDLLGARKVGYGEHCLGIVEQVGEEIVLDVLASQRLGIVAFDGECLAALIAGPAAG